MRAVVLLVIAILLGVASCEEGPKYRERTRSDLLLKSQRAGGSIKYLILASKILRPNTIYKARIFQKINW